MNAKIKKTEIRLESKGWTYWCFWLLLDQASGGMRFSPEFLERLIRGGEVNPMANRSPAELLAIEIMRVKDGRERKAGK